jgi:nucleotidyltransferase/DNA polymerase involved in DNA repair
MKIACVMVTHLPVKAELQRRPELNGKPIIITEVNGSKQVVLDSSPEARGVASGMTLQEALSQSKDATLLKVDETYYQAVFDDMVHSLELQSPLVEKAELGCVYVGLDGLETMCGGEARLMGSLLQAMPQDFNPRVGVADGKFSAYLAAVNSGGGQATKVPDDVAGFLKDFSVDLLPLSWEDKTRLHQFGLHTLGQVATLSVGPMQAQFGPVGKKVWELAQGIDRSPLLPEPYQELVKEFLTFPSPTLTLNAILTAIDTLLTRAFARPKVRDRYVRSIFIEGQISRHSPWIRQLAFKDAVGNKERAFFVIKNALELVTFDGPLEDLALTLVGLTGESGIQSSLLSDVRKHEQLREAVRQLEARMGFKPPIYQVRDMEPWSRIPERRQVLIRFDP